MITLSIITAESDEPAKFEIDAALVGDYVNLLRDPNAVLELTPRNGGTAYIPVRHITYLHVSEPADDPIDLGVPDILADAARRAAERGQR